MKCNGDDIRTRKRSCGKGFEPIPPVRGSCTTGTCLHWGKVRGAACLPWTSWAEGQTLQGRSSQRVLLPQLPTNVQGSQAGATPGSNVVVGKAGAGLVLQWL